MEWTERRNNSNNNDYDVNEKLQQQQARHRQQQKEMLQCDDDLNVDDDESLLLRPFEWLTSSISLKPYILKAMQSIYDHNDYSDNNHNNNNANATTTTTNSNNCNSMMSQQRGNKYFSVLHVGCGSSLLGEQLLEDDDYNINYVLNIDSDDSTLQRMKRRWDAKQQQLRLRQETVQDNDNTTTSIEMYHVKKVLEFQQFTFGYCVEDGTDNKIMKNTPSDNDTSSLFDIVIDKELLLHNIPGCDWEVSIDTMDRHTENLNDYNNDTILQNDDEINSKNEVIAAATEVATTATPTTEVAASTTTQQPEECSNVTTTKMSATDDDDDKYKTVKVVTCRRRPSSDHGCLDWDSVRQHVHQTCDEWFQKCNPLLTPSRIQEIYQAFATTSTTTSSTTTPTPDGENVEKEALSAISPSNRHDNDSKKSLYESYHILFTDIEKENYSYEADFLDDWYTFCHKRQQQQQSCTSTTTSSYCNGSLEQFDFMTAEMAIQFLNEVQ